MVAAPEGPTRFVRREFTVDAAREAMSVYRPDIFDAAVGPVAVKRPVPDCVGTQFGAVFDAEAFLATGA